MYVRNFEFFFHDYGNGGTVRSRFKHKRTLALNQMILLQPYTAGNGLNFVTKGKSILT